MSVEDKNQKTFVRNAGTVAGATLVSRIFGFLRDMVVALFLGTSAFTDAFVVAFRFPNLFRRLFAEGSLTMAFIPVYAEMHREQGAKRAFELARSVFAWLISILLVLIMVVEIFAPQFTSLLAEGFARDANLFEYTVLFVRICFPYILFISGVALCMGILNSSGHFLFPALAPVILNTVLISFAFLGHFLQENVALFLCIGVFFAGLLQWLFQQIALRHLRDEHGKRFSWRGTFSFFDEGTKKIAKLMLPTILGTAVYQVNIIVGTLFASFLVSGSISYLYYADRLMQFPLGIFGIAISTVALPNLSALAASKEWAKFYDTLRFSQGLTLFICFPAAAGLMGFAEPIISLLFQYGEFNAESVKATAQALFIYAFGLPFVAGLRPVIMGFYSRQDTKTPMYIGIFCLILNVCIAYFLLGTYAHLAIAFGVSFSSFINWLLLLIFFHLKKHEGVSVRCFPFATFFLSLLLSIGVYFLCEFFLRFGKYTLVFLPVVIIAYTVFSLVFRIKEAVFLADMIKRKKKGKSKSENEREK